MPSPVLAFAAHDHRRCRDTLMARLAEAARARGLRLTSARRRVLELLSEAHRAVGAYELLDRLRAEGLGAQPPAVYRALDFLISAGFAHRIERLNAYVACCHPADEPGAEHAAGFLICGECRAVAEFEDAGLDLAVAQAAAQRGFAMRRTVLEVEGLCPTCREIAR